MSSSPTRYLGRGSRAVVVLAVAGMMMLLALALSASSALADGCGNATLRALNDSVELPDCRAYEMVSSPYKQGFPPSPRAFTDDGIASYATLGSFADNGYGTALNEYLAVRTADGWKTRSVTPPASLYAYDPFGDIHARAGDLRSSLWLLNPLSQSADGPGYYSRSFDGAFTRIGQGPIPDGNNAYTKLASTDLSRIVFSHSLSNSGNVAETALWEYAGVGSSAAVRRLSVDNAGEWTQGETCPRAISRDGRVVVFFSGCNGTGIGRVWARVAGSATVAVSGSQCTRDAGDLGGACNGPSPADYVGGAVDGSRLFVTTEQQLVNADRDSTSDLYACDIPAGSPAPVGAANPCETLTRVSGPGDAASVESVVAVTKDASRVYFIAQGVLAANVGTSGVGAVAGNHNLYLWTKDAAHPAGQTTFVNALDAPALSWSQTVAGGRYLVFSTRTPLVGSGPGADTDGASDAYGTDVYRYDAKTETMLRLSTSVTGSGGNDPGYDARTYDEVALGGLTERLVSGVTADGSMVVFQTDEALSPSDANRTTDVYLWREGHVSLISRGGGRSPWISSTGEDIFFVTDQRLTAADGDVNRDIYDARVGGGFDLTQPAPCSGDACQGQRSVAPGATVPLAGGPGDGGLADVAPAVTLRTVSAAQRKRLAATGKVSLTVSFNTAGELRTTATATLAGRTSSIASARRTVRGPGSTTFTLTLSKKARAQLAVRGRLVVRITVTHSKVALARATTLRLIHAKTKAQKRSAKAKRSVSGEAGGRS